MLRLAIALAVLALVAAAGVVAKPPERHAALHHYLVEATSQIGVYRGLLRRLEKLLSDEPHVNVDPLVDDLYRLADRFDDLSFAWARIPVPRGLRLRHRGMGRVFVLFGEANRIHAAALYTRHPEEIAAAQPQAAARYKSAAYLQRRWAVALQGALIRADIRVPAWMHGMATAR